MADTQAEHEPARMQRTKSARAGLTRRGDPRVNVGDTGADDQSLDATEQRAGLGERLLVAALAIEREPKPSCSISRARVTTSAIGQGSLVHHTPMGAGNLMSDNETPQVVQYGTRSRP